MIWALILLVVVMITATSLALLQQRDSNEAADLEKGLTHYYIALAGIEYGHAALLADYDSKLFVDYYVKNNLNNLDSSYDIKLSGEDVGKAEVKIYNRTIDSIDWIVVESKGSAIGYSGSETLYMRMDPANPANVIKDGKTEPK